MVVYTYSEAKRSLALVLEQACKEGEVRIKRSDGRLFVVRPEPQTDSPLDIEGIDMGIATEEIVQLVRESRRSTRMD